MASIDYQEARKEIEKFFEEKNFGGRKILFWYDPPMNFKEDILNDSLDFCQEIFYPVDLFAVHIEGENIVAVGKIDSGW